MFTIMYSFAVSVYIYVNKKCSKAKKNKFMLFFPMEKIQLHFFKKKKHST